MRRLAQLQQAKALDDLLARVLDAREQVARVSGPVPVLLKIARPQALETISMTPSASRASVASQRHDHRDATIARPGLAARARRGGRPVGLSGRPLFRACNPRSAGGDLRQGRGRVPLIGAGGVDSARTAIAKIKAGASLE